MRVISDVLIASGGVIRPGEIGIEDGVIAAAGGPGDIAGDTYIDGRGLYLSHGFIDIHLHGGGGHDFMDGTAEAFHGASSLHLTHGTTGMLPTTLAAGREELETALRTYNACRGGFSDGAKFFGVHVEGPYLALTQCGAQDPAYIRDPCPQEYRDLLALCPDIRRWTVAPEKPGALEMGDWMEQNGIVGSIGHSDAGYDEVRKAISHGYSHVTHLYSAMSTITRHMGFRRAGIVESAYLLNDLTSEVIADGCHLPGSLLEMAYRFIGSRRLCLITDAMRAAGQTGGESILGSLTNGQRVILEDGVAKMPDRQAFAGSICTTDRLVRTMSTVGGAPLGEAVRMMTETPARAAGISGKTGYLLPGRAADLVLFDENINIKYVLTDGEVRYEGE